MNGHQELIKSLRAAAIRCDEEMTSAFIPGAIEAAANALEAIDAGVVCALPAPPAVTDEMVNAVYYAIWPSDAPYRFEPDGGQEHKDKIRRALEAALRIDEKDQP